MKFGYMCMNSAYGIRPARLATELEQRGFDSFWVPEHSHIPVDRTSPFITGGELPEGYLHMMNPLVSLASAASVTTRLKLGTGVCLLLQHTLPDLAMQTATLDVLSDGRLEFGVGVGWNAEELADHRPELPFRQRYSAMRERIDALRTLWRDEVASFDGKYEKFSPSWVYPKPVRGAIPVLLGNFGPVGISHAAACADEWMPIDHMLKGADGKPDVAGRIADFRAELEKNGRDPSAVPISLFMFSRPTPDRIERYAALGVHRLIVSPPHANLQDADFTLRHLDELSGIVEGFGAATG